MNTQHFQIKRTVFRFAVLALAIFAASGLVSARALAAQNQAIVHPDPLSVGMRSGQDKDVGDVIHFCSPIRERRDVSLARADRGGQGTEQVVRVASVYGAVG